MRPIDYLMDRLAELAAGAEPDCAGNGICWEAHVIIPNEGRYTVMYGFSFLGLDQWDPLGDAWKTGNKWSGRRGQRRRRLCYDLLVQFIASAGYRGRYQ